MKSIHRAYLLLFVAILFATVVSRGHTIDIHVHDTKFVVANFYIGLVLISYGLLLAIANYWISKYRDHVSLFQC